MTNPGQLETVPRSCDANRGNGGFQQKQGGGSHKKPHKITRGLGGHGRLLMYYERTKENKKLS